MNEIFNFRRFGKCLASDLVRGASKYGITLLILSFLEVLVFLFMHILMLIFNRNGNGLEIADAVVNVNAFPVDMVFFIAVTILVLGMPTSLYGHVTNRHAGADYLMVPASSLEKFLSMIIVCAIIFPAVFLGIFLGTDALLGVIDSHYNSLWNGFLLRDLNVPIWLMILSLFSSVVTYLLGAIWFRRHKIIYTLLILLAIGIVAGIAIAELAINTDIFDGLTDVNINSFKVNWTGFAWAAIALVLCYFRIRKIQH
ncbi:MAG: hypothetical protein LUC24_02840 [Bacteroidales bacterium]|nr:hypothetical protein [Bacteroidales bacterium]